MTGENATPPAGWYPDAAVVGGMRWWDGTAWTEHRQTPPPDPVVVVSGAVSPAVAGSTGARRPYAIPDARYANVDVVGEAWREDELERALGRSLRVDEEVEEYRTAILVPEPDNPHDRHAISVRIDGQVVGYIAREETAKYLAAVNRITASGYDATTVARIWAVKRRQYDGELRINSNIRVAIPWNGIELPINNPPQGSYSLLPWGGAVQITGEEDHFSHLKRYVPKSGSGVLILTLHRTSRALKSGQEREFVEVRLDGEPIGELSPTTSRHFLPTIDHHAERAIVVASWARIQGSPLSAEVKVQGAKASELDADWLEGAPALIGTLIPAAAKYDVPNAYIAQAPRTGTPVQGKPAAAAGAPLPTAATKGGCALVIVAGAVIVTEAVTGLIRLIT